MELHDKIDYTKAIIVDECILTELDQCIREFFKSSEYSADLLDGSRVYFGSLDELLQYENFGDKAIELLRVDFGYSNSLIFDQTVSYFHSYKYSLTVKYVTKNMNDSALFKKEMFKIFEKSRRPWYYTFVTKFSMMYFLTAFILWFVVFCGILYLKGMFEFRDSPLSVGVFSTWIISTASIFVVAYLMSRIRKILFPVISYKIGEQKKQIERKDDLISKFFWGVIVTGIISVIISILI